MYTYIIIHKLYLILYIFRVHVRILEHIKRANVRIYNSHGVRLCITENYYRDYDNLLCHFINFEEKKKIEDILILALIILETFFSF